MVDIWCIYWCIFSLTWKITPCIEYIGGENNGDQVVSNAKLLINGTKYMDPFLVYILFNYNTFPGLVLVYI